MLDTSKRINKGSGLIFILLPLFIKEINESGSFRS